MNIHHPFIKKTPYQISSSDADLIRLKELLQNAAAVLIGAGAGLSTAAGYTYGGERFQKNFADFSARYHYQDMYTAGFYPYATSAE